MMLIVCVQATALGLDTRGSDAGNADNLSTLIITGDFVDFYLESFYTQLFIWKCSEMLKASACFLRYKNGN